MPLSSKNIRRLQTVIKSLQTILDDPQRPTEKRAATPGATRVRRTGKDLTAFRKAIAADRKRGISVAEIAETYGVTPSYVYQMPSAPAPGKAKSKPKNASGSRRARGRKADAVPAATETSGASEQSNASSET